MRCVSRFLRTDKIAVVLRSLAINALMALHRRPILFIDSSLCQFDWIELPIALLQLEGLKRLVPAIHRRLVIDTSKSDKEPNVDDWPFIYEHGVRLADTVLHSICVELEIGGHELDLQNPSHAKSAVKWLGIAKSLCLEIIELIETCRPDTIVIFQGYFLESAIVRQLQKRYQFMLCVLECTFVSDRLICENISGNAVNRTSASAYFEKDYPANYWIEPSSIDLYNKFITTKTVGKISDHCSPPRSFEWSVKSQKRILFLAQCFTDSSLVFGETKGYSSVEIIQSLREYALRREMQLFIKLHPKEANGFNTLGNMYNKLTYRRLIQADAVSVHSRPDLIMYDDENTYSTAALMQDCDVVITINSQSGLEALAAGKEVVLCGRAFYDFLRCAWIVQDCRQLEATLNLILNEGVRLNNQPKSCLFAFNYLNSFCIPKNAGSIMERLLG